MTSLFYAFSFTTQPIRAMTFYETSKTNKKENIQIKGAKRSIKKQQE